MGIVFATFIGFIGASLVWLYYHYVSKMDGYLLKRILADIPFFAVVPLAGALFIQISFLDLFGLDGKYERVASGATFFALYIFILIQIPLRYRKVRRNLARHKKAK
jgi:hypothetical protein